MNYTHEQIVEKTNTALKTPTTLYRHEVFNYRGQVDGEQYTEISAKELLKHIDLLDLKIKTINRTNYKVASHDKLSQSDQPVDSNRDEEWLAKRMYKTGINMNVVGKILDYQIPLKSVLEDDAGKIDLLTYNEQTQTAYILELKREGSTETLLRCALEIYTYSKQVNLTNLFASYNLPNNTNLCKGVIVFRDCQANKDYQGKSTNIQQLMNQLGIDFFVIDREVNDVVESYLFQNKKI